MKQGKIRALEMRRGYNTTNNMKEGDCRGYKGTHPRHRQTMTADVRARWLDARGRSKVGKQERSPGIQARSVKPRILPKSDRLGTAIFIKRLGTEERPSSI